MILLTLATVATLADAAAFGLLVVPGAVREANPLVHGADPGLALAAKVALVVVLVAFGRAVGSSRLTRLVLSVAVVVGAVGFASTLGSL